MAKVQVIFAIILSTFAIVFGLPQDCNEVGKESGIYTISPANSSLFSNGVEVFCDMETDGGGWTVIQRRRESENQIDFYRNWQEYAEGFGTLTDSFWLGLDLISELTKEGNKQLRIDMEDWEGETAYAEYDLFQVADSSDLYRLNVQGYHGTAGDSLIPLHNGMAFSTKDRDNDLHECQECAKEYQGAWWYKSCHYCNLNGVYGDVEYGRGVKWYTWRGYYYSLKRVEMKIRTAI